MTDATGGPLPYHEAAALIGVEIETAQLVRTSRVPVACGCLEHTLNPHCEQWGFCPWCGKTLYDEQVTTIPEWDSTDPGNLLLAGCPVVTTAHPDTPGLELTPLGRAVIRDGVRVFVGEIVSRTDAAHPAHLVTVSDQMLSDARARLRLRLEPLGLWDDKRFGVWAVLNRVR